MNDNFFSQNTNAYGNEITNLLPDLGNDLDNDLFMPIDAIEDPQYLETFDIDDLLASLDGKYPVKII